MVGGDGFTTTAIISVATMTSVQTPSTVYESSTSETDTETASSATTSVASFNSDPITVTEEETVTAPAVTTTLTESTTTTAETTSDATTTVATTETKLTFVPRAPFTATVSILDETSTASAAESATSSASSSGTPVSCPVEGAACAVHGELACNGYSYGQCVWGTWVVRQCYTGLACMDDGDEIACDYPGPSGVQACSESGISTDSAKLMKRGVWDDDLEYNHEMAESNDIWQHMHRKAKRSITHDHVLRKPVARRDESPFYDAELGKKHHPHVPMRKLHAHEDKPAPAARPRPRHLQHMKAAILKREEAGTAAATVTGMAAMPTMLQKVEFCPDGTSTTYIAGSATTTATASASATASADSSELEDLTLDSSDNNTYLLRVVTQQVNSTTFVGTLYAAPLTNSPIGQNWKFSFTSDDTITSVSRGELVAGDDGSYSINSIATQEGKRYMAIKVTFWGTYNTDS
ncbi:hypothetical protein BZA70DRAFT_286147 [Myxozyma melibiosi]|uniref:Carbohydrate-binding module family 19 domain-containing protein n=1 Tax=Myxozyma melibiosi TaxID=54550 RepID=A0ABR1EY03_9ASCO